MPSWSPCSICCNSRPAVSNAWPQQEISLLRLRGHLWVLCHDMWLKYKIIWTKVLHAHRRKKYYKDATDWYYYFCVVLSRVQLFVTPQTAAHQAPLSTEFSRQEYWRGLPLPTPGIFLTQGPNSHFLHLPHWHCTTWEALFLFLLSHFWSTDTDVCLATKDRLAQSPN